MALPVIALKAIGATAGQALLDLAMSAIGGIAERATGTLTEEVGNNVDAWIRRTNTTPWAEEWETLQAYVADGAERSRSEIDALPSSYWDGLLGRYPGELPSSMTPSMLRDMAMALAAGKELGLIRTQRQNARRGRNMDGKRVSKEDHEFYYCKRSGQLAMGWVRIEGGLDKGPLPPNFHWSNLTVREWRKKSCSPLRRAIENHRKERRIARQQS